MTSMRGGRLAFMKMHGLGNDFVVVDARARAPGLTPDLVRRIGDRHTGLGFDQLAVIDAGKSHGGAAADAHLTFWNADGSTSGTCGNATRCVARFLMEESGRAQLRLTTEGGDLKACDAGRGMTAVNMGAPRLAWDAIPLAEEMETLELPIEGGPTATGMGNPHCTFFVADAQAVPLEQFGPRYETHPLFPERTNVQVVSVTGPDRLRMRVWERGVGITRASGSSSCAVAVAAARRGLAGRGVRIDLDGGSLQVDWRDDGVWMTGPTMHVADGILTPAFLEAAE